MGESYFSGFDKLVRLPADLLEKRLKLALRPCVSALINRNDETLAFAKYFSDRKRFGVQD